MIFESLVMILVVFFGFLFGLMESSESISLLSVGGMLVVMEEGSCGGGFFYVCVSSMKLCVGKGALSVSSEYASPPSA